MRTSRMTTPPTPGSGGAGKVIAVVLLIAATVFLVVSLSSSSWFNDNVVTPVLSLMDGEPESTPAPSPTPGRMSDTITLDEQTFYLLQGGIFTDMTNASAQSQELKGRGGAGYIMEDGERLRVFLSAYATEASAKEIKARLSDEQDMETYVYAITLPAYSVSLGATAEQVAAAEDAFLLPSYAIETLIGVSHRYDRAEDVTAELDGLKDKTAAALANIEANLKDSSDESITLVVDFCRELNDVVSGLNGAGSKDMKAASELKYAAIQLIDGYAGLIESLK